MMITKKITPRDWESLSAYLDGQLAAKERQKLESRLETDQDLQAALEGLRRTRSVLRSQPRMRAPRNFTLSPEMAGLRTKLRPVPRLYPTLRLASLLATLFFVLIFVGDLLYGPRQPVAISLNQAAEESPGPMFFPGMGGGGGGGGGVDIGAAPPAVDVSAEVTVVVEEPAASDAQETQLGAQSAPADVERVPDEVQATPAAELMLAPTPVPTEAAVLEQPVEALPLPAAKEVPAPEAPELQGQAAGEREMTPDTAAQEESRPEFQITYSFLRVLQGLLALLAVASGAAAFYLRRRSI